jgi:hypothetical protein
MNEETTMILIDTALASGSASALDPEERKLQELVLTVRDDAPAPDPDFALRLNARVAAGFPTRRSGLRGRLGALFATRPPTLAMGAVAMLLIGIVVAISALNGSGTNQSSIPAGGESAAKSAGGGSALAGSSAGGSTAGAPAGQSTAGAPSNGSSDSAAPERAAQAPGITAPAQPSIAPVPPVPGGVVGGRNRKVERSAALVLAAPKDKISEVGDQVIAVTDRYRGIVMSSSVTSAGDNESNGTFDLRIPVGNLRGALRDLSGLADVQSRTENADDVTASFVSARTRLEELQAERRGLLRRLARAQTDNEAAAIRARIRIVNDQIDAQTQTLTDMRRRTNYAVVNVTLQSKQGGSGGGGISGGAKDLRDSLIDSANLALRVLGVALPIAILVALLWAGGGWFSRRRREAVLD